MVTATNSRYPQVALIKPTSKRALRGLYSFPSSTLQSSQCPSAGLATWNELIPVYLVISNIFPDQAQTSSIIQTNAQCNRLKSSNKTQKQINILQTFYGQLGSCIFLRHHSNDSWKFTTFHKQVKTSRTAKVYSFTSSKTTFICNLKTLQNGKVNKFHAHAYM